MPDLHSSSAARTIERTRWLAPDPLVLYIGSLTWTYAETSGRVQLALVAPAPILVERISVLREMRLTRGSGGPFFHVTSSFCRQGPEDQFASFFGPPLGHARHHHGSSGHLSDSEVPLFRGF